MMPMSSHWAWAREWSKFSVGPAKGPIPLGLLSHYKSIGTVTREELGVKAIPTLILSPASLMMKRQRFYRWHRGVGQRQRVAGANFSDWLITLIGLWLNTFAIIYVIEIIWIFLCVIINYNHVWPFNCISLMHFLVI